MENQAKLASAILGGYFLGRTKKGGLALRLAARMATSGTKQEPAELVRANLNRLLASGIVDQLREQAAAAARASFDARVQGLSASLDARTARIKAKTATGAAETLSGAADTLSAANDTVSRVADTAQGANDTATSMVSSMRSQDGQDQGSLTDRDGQGEEQSDDQPDRPQDEPDGDEQWQPDEGREKQVAYQVEQLSGHDIDHLRHLAQGLGFEEHDLEGKDAPVLARWIAEAQVQDEAQSEVQG